ncbi:MAG: sel1 repeat family protein [Pseudoxanthomonas sp.]|nr:sel1 repeat family protein [Pseudoxanthomonas sp.]
MTPGSSLAPDTDVDDLAGRLRTTPEGAFGAVLEAARAGQVPAQSLLAQMYMEGKGVARDAEAALLWYAVAANNGDAMAMNMLGRCHELGEGTAIDFVLAATWYRRAADSGLDWGMYNHANLLATGRGVARDEARALELYTRAAGLGHAKSMNLLARHLEDGLETGADPQAALDWYRRSAEAGDFRGQANYASILLQKGEVAQATHWLRQALAHGSPSFMAHIVPELAASPHPQIRELVSHQAS